MNMHIVLYSKPFFQRCLRPTTQMLAAMGITANQVTVANILVSVIAGTSVLLYVDESWPLFLIPCALIIRFILNHIDGMLAREHNMQTTAGLILNELADIISDVVLYLPLALNKDLPGVLIVIIVVLAVLTEFTGLLGAAIGADRRQDGPMGKRPRGVAFSLTAFLLAIGITPGIWTDVLLAGMVPLLILTCICRVMAAMKQLNEGSCA